MSAATVAVVSVSAGLSAGTAVLCWPPRRTGPDPVRRLAVLTRRPGEPTGRGSQPAHAKDGGVPVIAALQSARDRRLRDAESERLAPLAADLLAACLSSGSTPARAAEAVAAAVRPPGRLVSVADRAAFETAGRFQEVAALLRLGGNPVTSWRPLAVEPGLESVATAAARACLTGAPPAEAVGWAADDLRAARRARGTAAARQAGVRAVGPLTGCFLPAFLFLGVIPTMIGLVMRLLP